MSRDRTARTRIRLHLQDVGPIDDPSGHATSRLKDAVAYEGSSVAFIQIVAAMDRDGEISREIRGKRTYRIVLEDAGRLDPVILRQGAPGGGSRGTVARVDYDKLARAIVRELWASLDQVKPDDLVHESSAEERRAAYMHRLESARTHLDELLGVIAARRDAARR